MITRAQALALTYRQEIYGFAGNNGRPIRVRINGAVKTWKTRLDIEVPVKYGLYECNRFTLADLENWYLTAEERDACGPNKGKEQP